MTLINSVCSQIPLVWRPIIHILHRVSKRAVNILVMQPENDLKASAPIFLICSEHSGLNLISSIVGEHPEAYAHAVPLCPPRRDDNGDRAT
jgi:hypothetical protein